MTTDTQELLKKVRRIELKTKGLSNQIFSGEYHSAFKGRGMAFSEVREYMPGDEIRTIDWNVTARFGHPYVKVFEEERELTAIILVDISESDAFGSRSQRKADLITEISATLSFSAIQNNDKIGVVFFSGEVEKYIPPKKGRSHILRVIRELIEIKPQHKGTDLNKALEFVNKVVKKRSIVFILSDFLSPDFEKNLRYTNRRHDVVALRIKDQREDELPAMGLALFRDSESGAVRWIDTSNRKTRALYKAQALERDSKLHQQFSRNGIDFATLYTGQPYIQPLLNLIKRRGQ